MKAISKALETAIETDATTLPEKINRQKTIKACLDQISRHLRQSPGAKEPANHH